MKIHYRTKSGKFYLLNKEPNTTMQEVTTKIQEESGLQLSQVSLSMVKNSCKCGHDVTHFLLEGTSKIISTEVEPLQRLSLAKLKDDIVSEIKTKVKTAINAKLDKIELTKHQGKSEGAYIEKTAAFFGK